MEAAHVPHSIPTYHLTFLEFHKGHGLFSWFQGCQSKKHHGVFLLWLYQTSKPRIFQLSHQYFTKK